MPGISVESERVPIRPKRYGKSIWKWFVRLASSGSAKSVSGAGASCVSQMASIAAIFVGWSRVTRKPDSSPMWIVITEAMRPNTAAMRKEERAKGTS